MADREVRHAYELCAVWDDWDPDNTSPDKGDTIRAKNLPNSKANNYAWIGFKLSIVAVLFVLVPITFSCLVAFFTSLTTTLFSHPTPPHKDWTENSITLHTEELLLNDYKIIRPSDYTNTRFTARANGEPISKNVYGTP